MEGWNGGNDRSTYRQSAPAAIIFKSTTSEIRLRGDIEIAVHTNSFRSIRGRTLLAVVFDEVAFWRDETSSQPDIETYRAVLPALATTQGMLIGISSPYRRIGLLHQKHRDYFGVDDPDTLVVQGPTIAFNPTISTAIVDRARRDDPTSALAEWDAEFRSDLSQFLDDDTIDGAIDHGRPLELPPREGVTYFGFVDASAGRHDAFCIGIVHAEATEDREASAPKRLIADVVRGVKPPFDPKSVAQEFAKLAKGYGIGALTGDQYAGQWVAGAFQDAGIDYQASPLPKSQLYLEGLPHFMRGLVSIPDQPQLLRELRLLERRTARSGKDSVDHGQSGSDDFANVLFGALYLAAGKREQHIPMAAPFVVSRPYDFPSSDGDMQNPAIGRGVHSGGESAMERFAGGARPGNGYEWPI